MGSHLESYWLTDVNRLVSFYEFFRMYANGLIHQKTIVWTVAIEFFLFWLIESLFSIWKFLIFIFSEKKNSRELHQNSRKKMLAYCTKV